MLNQMKLFHKFAIGLSTLAVMVSLATAVSAGSNGAEEGREIYLQHCAPCHGRSGDGYGPVAPCLSKPPTDLRLLWKRYGNPLPEDQIARFIDGRADVKAHGPREMPVWGEYVWKKSEGKQGQRRVKQAVSDIIAYLQSIQTAQTASAY